MLYTSVLCPCAHNECMNTIELTPAKCSQVSLGNYICMTNQSVPSYWLEFLCQSLLELSIMSENVIFKVIKCFCHQGCSAIGV